MTDTTNHDRYGPETVLTVFDAATGMEGYVVIDNTALGLGKGGIRMTPNVSAGEVARLARTMTWKNALAGIPFGGAKAGMKWNGGPPKQKEAQVRAFARAISPFVPERYVAGPDVNSGEAEMGWIAEELKSLRASTGKPATMKGLPHELGSTGFGVAQSVKVAAKLHKIALKGARVAIEGYGNVGSFAARFLSEMGAKIIAVSDSQATAHLESGLDTQKLNQLKGQKLSVGAYPGVSRLKSDAIFGLPADILVLATVTDVITAKNKHKLKVKLLAQGSNIPMSEAIEEELYRRGMIIIPDFVANAGGVISSYAEYKGWSKERMFQLVEEKIIKTTEAVMTTSLTQKIPARQAAMKIAQKRVTLAMKARS